MSVQVRHPTTSGSQRMTAGVHAHRGRRADPQHIANERCRHVRAGHRLLLGSIAPKLFVVTKEPDTARYTVDFLPNVSSLTMGCVVAPSVPVDARVDFPA